jgi:hypothetical protein
MPAKSGRRRYGLTRMVHRVVENKREKQKTADNNDKQWKLMRAEKIF